MAAAAQAQEAVNPPAGYTADTASRAYRLATAGHELRRGPGDPSAPESVLWSVVVEAEITRQLTWLFQWMAADTKALDSLMQKALERNAVPVPMLRGAERNADAWQAGSSGPNEGGGMGFSDPAPGRATTSERTGPVTTENGATVASEVSRTVWVENGKIGEENQITASASATINGASVTRTDVVRFLIEVAYCPDREGISTGRFEWSEISTLSGAVTMPAAGIRVMATLEGYVDDDALLTGVDMDMEPQSVEGGTIRSLGRAASKGWKPTIETLSLAPSGRWAQPYWKVSRLSGLSTGTLSLQAPAGTTPDQSQILQRLALAGELHASASMDIYYRKAMHLWREGACVQVVVLRGEERKTLRPSERVVIEAESEHKLEGRRLDAPIEAHLFGSLVLAPQGQRLPPAARFAYEAPAHGTPEAALMMSIGSTVDLLSISRRGIGRQELDYKLEPLAIRVRLDEDRRFSQSGAGFRVDLRMDSSGETLVPITFTSAWEFEGEADLLKSTTGYRLAEADPVTMRCDTKGSEKVRITVKGNLDSMEAIDLTIEGAGSGQVWEDSPCEIKSTKPEVDVYHGHQVANELSFRMRRQFPAGKKVTLASGVVMAFVEGSTTTVPVQGAAAEVFNTRITITVVKQQREGSSPSP